MRAAITAVLVAAAVIALAWWVAGLSGSVAATVAGYTVETTVPVALTALVASVLLILLLARLLSGLFRVPARMGRRSARLRRDAGDRAVTRTLVALASNDSRAARTESARARRLLGDTPQTLLHAAEAARLAGRDDDAAALFRTLSERRDAGFLGLRGLFRLAIARKDWAGANAFVGQAEALRPGGNWLRSERAELAVRTGNWQRALALAGPETPTAAYAVAAAEAEPNIEQAIRMAGRAWKDNPGFTPAALAYAGKLRQSGRESRVQSVLRDAWRQAPHPDLAAFALAKSNDPIQRLKEGSRLAQGNPGHPESLFLLAQLAQANGQPDEARRHAEAARNAGMNQQRLYKLLAELDGRHNQPQNDTLRLEPDSGWHCEACGAAHEHWMTVCPACDTPGRIVWGRPGSAASWTSAKGGALRTGSSPT